MEFHRQMARVKNYILPILIVLGSIPYKYFDNNANLNLGLFFDRPIRLANMTYYYITSITAIVLVWMLYRGIRINKRVLRVVLIIAIIDFLCLFIFSGQLLYNLGLSDYGTAIKLTVALIIEWIYDSVKRVF